MTQHHVLVGAKFVLVGHSERKQYFGEDSPLIAQKVSTALTYGLRPILCCGESQQTRAAGQQEAFVNGQLAANLFRLTEAQIAQVIIAYEPVWAIGTGVHKYSIIKSISSLLNKGKHA